MMAKSEKSKTFALNKKARHEYILIEQFEAGLSLTGSEVKSVRAGKVNINDAYVKINNGEMFLTGAHISEYKYLGYAVHDPNRDKKILMNKNEIIKLSSQIAEKGLTLVALSLYPKNRYIKLKLALAKGKKTHDKRDELRKKAIERDIDRRYKIR